MTSATELDPFAERLWGPEGRTAPFVEQLAPYMVGLEDGGLRHFVGVPVPTALEVDSAMVLVVDGDDKGPSPGVVAEIVEVLGPAVTFCGFAVVPSRGDERVEFTCTQLDAATVGDDQLDQIVEAAWAAGFSVDVDRGEPGRRATIR